jgi:hypothetical protein
MSVLAVPAQAKLPQALAAAAAPVPAQKPVIDQSLVLGKDTFSSSVRAQGAEAQIPDISAIRTLQNVNNIASQGLSYFTFDNMPTYQYQDTRTRTRKDGSQYTQTTYNWGAAFADVTAKLSAISAITGNENDPHCQEISRLASQALNVNSWEHMLDAGTAATRYLGLSNTLREIQQLTNDTPEQPGVTVNRMDGSIAGADANINDLRRALNDPTVKASDLDQKVQAKIAADHAKAKAIPFWHYLLLFGLFEKGGANGDASDLQNNLSTVRQANPDQLATRLAADKSRANDVVQQATSVRTLDGARGVSQAAKPVTDDANAIKGQAEDQRNHINDLIKSLSGQ